MLSWGALLGLVHHRGWMAQGPRRVARGAPAQDALLTGAAAALETPSPCSPCSAAALQHTFRMAGLKSSSDISSNHSVHISARSLHVVVSSFSPAPQPTI